MRVLGIETSTAASSVALGEDRDLVAMAANVDARGHVGFLVPALEFCFSQSGWSPSDLDLIAVDIGPGLFSGIRTGMATAQAIAGAIGVPLVPVSSLDAVALRAATGHRHVWSVVDARRSQVAIASYRPVPGGMVRDAPAELVDAAGFRAIIESDPADVLVVGDWRALPEETLRGLHGVRLGAPRYPTADAVIEAAIGLAERGGVPHPDEIRPRYLREPDVAINWTDFREEGKWTQD